MTGRQKLALKRLRTWSDPNARGKPLRRLVEMWHTPIEMAKDIHVLLELVLEP